MGGGLLYPSPQKPGCVSLNQCWRQLVPIAYCVQLIFQHWFGGGGKLVYIVPTLFTMFVAFPGQTEFIIQDDTVIDAHSTNPKTAITTNYSCFPRFNSLWLSCAQNKKRNGQIEQESIHHCLVSYHRSMCARNQISPTTRRTGISKRSATTATTTNVTDAPSFPMSSGR